MRLPAALVFSALALRERYASAWVLHSPTRLLSSSDRPYTTHGRLNRLASVGAKGKAAEPLPSKDKPSTSEADDKAKSAVPAKSPVVSKKTSAHAGAAAEKEAIVSSSAVESSSAGSSTDKPTTKSDDKTKSAFPTHNTPKKFPDRASAEVKTTGIESSRTRTDGSLHTGKNGRVYGAISLSDLKALYDLVVVGGGPAGVAGAVKAAQMGRRSIIIDRPKCDGAVLPDGLDLFFGGPTGLFSKALRDAAKNTNVEAMVAQGLDDDVIWKQITNTVTKLALRNAEGQMKLLKRLGIDYLQGEAMLLGLDHPDAIHAAEEVAESIDDDCTVIRSLLVKNAPVIIDGLARYEEVHEGVEVVVSAPNVLVATGSKSLRLPGIPFDGHRVFDSETINTLSFFPHSVVISGAGIIAIEFANIFKALGCESVTLLIRGDLESSAKKLGMDQDVSNELIRLLLKSGVKIREHITIKEFEHVPAEGEEGKIAMRLSDDSLVESDIFLAAVGRVPRGMEEETGLDAAGVEVTERGMVKLSDKKTLSTTSLQVSAAGDVIGPPALASTSMEQAQRAVEAMFREEDIDGKKDFNPDEILSIGVWTIPEMGYYGLTKDAAEKQGHNVVEGVANFDECLRGRCFAPDGLLKLIVDSDNGRVLGVHLIGKEAAEMVHYGMALVKAETTIFDLVSTTFTAVTFHELFKEAAFDANSKLDFGMEWQEIFRQLTDGCAVDSSGEPTKIGQEELKLRFDEIDEDGSGELDENELMHLFKTIGRPVSKRTIANLMRLSDADKSGTIDWDEFKTIFEKVQC